MLQSVCPSKLRSLFLATIWSIVAASLIVGSFLIVGQAQPAFAWWFLASTQPTAKISATSSELILTPLRPTLVAQLILQPLATPTPTPMPTVTPTRSKLAGNRIVPATRAAAVAPWASTEATQLLAAVNAARANAGLASLTLNKALSDSAQRYAEQMEREKFFSHTSPDGTTFNQRNEAAGYRGWWWMGENIAYGYDTVDEVMIGWMNSPTHKANILNPKAEEMGIGTTPRIMRHWVQEFGAR